MSTPNIDCLANKAITFDSCDVSPVLFGTGESARSWWLYFTEVELSPGAARVGNYKVVFNLRGDDGVSTGGLAVDAIGDGRGYFATVPQVFDLWQDQPQHRRRGVATDLTPIGRLDLD